MHSWKSSHLMHTGHTSPHSTETIMVRVFRYKNLRFPKGNMTFTKVPPQWILCVHGWSLLDSSCVAALLFLSAVTRCLSVRGHWGGGGRKTLVYQLEVVLIQTGQLVHLKHNVNIVLTMGRYETDRVGEDKLVLIQKYFVTFPFAFLTPCSLWCFLIKS